MTHFTTIACAARPAHLDTKVICDEVRTFVQLGEYSCLQLVDALSKRATQCHPDTVADLLCIMNPLLPASEARALAQSTNTMSDALVLLRPTNTAEHAHINAVHGVHVLLDPAAPPSLLSLALFLDRFVRGCAVPVLYATFNLTARFAVASLHYGQEFSDIHADACFNIATARAAHRLDSDVGLIGVSPYSDLRLLRHANYVHTCLLKSLRMVWQHGRCPFEEVPSRPVSRSKQRPIPRARIQLIKRA